MGSKGERGQSLRSLVLQCSIELWDKASESLLKSVGRALHLGSEAAVPWPHTPRSASLTRPAMLGPQGRLRRTPEEEMEQKDEHGLSCEELQAAGRPLSLDGCQHQIPHC